MPMIPFIGYGVCRPLFSGWFGRKVKNDLIHEAGCRCAACGGEVSYDEASFHHRNPEKKAFELNTKNIERKPMEAVLDEFRKTELVHKDCHLQIHRRNDPKHFDKEYLQSREPRQADEDTRLARLRGKINYLV